MGSGELQTLGSGNERACLLVKLEITPTNRGAACRSPDTLATPLCYVKTGDRVTLIS